MDNFPRSQLFKVSSGRRDENEWAQSRSLFQSRDSNLNFSFQKYETLKKSLSSNILLRTPVMGLMKILNKFRKVNRFRRKFGVLSPRNRIPYPGIEVDLSLQESPRIHSASTRFSSQAGQISGDENEKSL